MKISWVVCIFGFVACGGSTGSGEGESEAEAESESESEAESEAESESESESESEAEPHIAPVFSIPTDSLMQVVAKVADTLDGPEWISLAPQVHVPGFDLPESTPSNDEGMEYYVAQVVDMMSEDGNEVIGEALTAIVLHEDENFAIDDFAELPNSNDADGKTVEGPNPELTDQYRYFTRESEITLRFRIGRIVGRVTGLDGAQSSAEDLLARANPVLETVAGLLEGTWTPSPFPDTLSALLPSDEAATDLGPQLGQAVIPLESNTENPSEELQTIYGASDQIAYRIYGRWGGSNDTVDAWLLSFENAGGASLWATQYSGNLSTGETGENSWFGDSGTWLEYNFAKGNAGVIIDCFQYWDQEDGVSDSCEDAVRNFATAWYAELPAE